MVEQLERTNPRLVERNGPGEIVELALPPPFATDRHLAAVGQLHSLRKLRIYNPPPTNLFTGRGIAGLRPLTNLTTLLFLCRPVPPGVLTAVAELPQLRTLYLTGADAPANEYPRLAGLTNLSELRIHSSRNFGE